MFSLLSYFVRYSTGQNNKHVEIPPMVMELTWREMDYRSAPIKIQDKQRLFSVHFIREYLHSPTISLDEPILERRGSYTHERHSFTRRYA